MQGFQTVQELIFIKLNEQIRALQSDKNKAEEIKEELRQQVMVGITNLILYILNQVNARIFSWRSLGLICVNSLLNLLDQLVVSRRSSSEKFF